MAADLNDVVSVLKNIRDELNVRQTGSAVDVILYQLKMIEGRLGDIEMEIKNLQR
jgi:hypothetical protein